MRFYFVFCSLEKIMIFTQGCASVLGALWTMNAKFFFLFLAVHHRVVVVVDVVRFIVVAEMYIPILLCCKLYVHTCACVCRIWNWMKGFAWNGRWTLRELYYHHTSRLRWKNDFILGSAL